MKKGAGVSGAGWIPGAPRNRAVGGVAVEIEWRAHLFDPTGAQHDDLVRHDHRFDLSLCEWDGLGQAEYIGLRHYEDLYWDFVDRDACFTSPKNNLIWPFGSSRVLAYYMFEVALSEYGFHIGYGAVIAVVLFLIMMYFIACFLWSMYCEEKAA